MTKRDRIALALWHERQPRVRAAVWNTLHPRFPRWAQAQFARYVSWRFMGGHARWHQKILPALAFWLTLAIFAWLCRKVKA